MVVKSADKNSSYSFDKLPSKLKVWHKYAQNFLKVLYCKTPWHSYTVQNAQQQNYNELYFDVFYNYEVICDVVSMINGDDIGKADSII